ncbi:hypothetical protein Tco_0549825, partial [Tanacetum coccineum]
TNERQEDGRKEGSSGEEHSWSAEDRGILECRG